MRKLYTMRRQYLLAGVRQPTSSNLSAFAKQIPYLSERPQPDTW